jgi:hypothetical protein
MMRRKLWAALALLVTPTAVEAQDLGVFTAGLFKNIHSVTLYAQGGKINDAEAIEGGHSECFSTMDICGAGIEMLIDLTPTTKNTHVELGLGASYLRGFQSSRSDLDLHGSIRSFPSVSAYVTRTSLFGIKTFQPYLGLSFGITDLWNAQAYDTLRHRFAVRGQTFDWGGVVGMSLQTTGFQGLFVEAGYRRRRFASIDWGIPSKLDETLPAGWPRELNLSGLEVSIGWQFDFSDDEKKSPPPAFVGAWRLTAFDGQNLPTTFSQRLLSATEEPKNGSERDDIVDGTLRIDSTAFKLAVFHRVARLDSSGKPVVVGDLTVQQDSGAVSLTDRGVKATLDPNGPAPPFVPERRGDTILVRLPETNHTLTFTKLPG